MTDQTPHHKLINNDAGLWNFLRKWGVATENITQMQKDKIDASIVREMDDTCLARYIPAYGDRIAARRYCLDKQKRKEDNCSKMSLLEKLRKKMRTATASRDEESGEESTPTNKERYKNNSQKIELGWIHEGKQVRKRNGGGTRVLAVSKDATKKDLMCHAKELFFPRGESKKGKLENFIHNIYDFKESELDESVTIGELYTQSKFGILRFYLITKWKIDKSGTEVEHEVHRHGDTVDQYMEKPLDVNELQSESSCAAEECNDGTSSAHSAVVDVIDLTSLSYDPEVLVGGLVNVSTASEQEDTVPVCRPIEEDFRVVLSTSSSVVGDYVQRTVHTSGNADYELHNDTHLDEPVLVFPPTEVISVTSSTSGPFIEGENEYGANYELVSVEVKLHRVTLLEEMISQFKDESILSYPLKYSFVNERGQDADGVARDVYAAFWSEFLDCAAEGAEMRVPSLSPKWQGEEWKAVGRILVKGFIDQGYFPLRLAPAFTTALIFGEHAVCRDLLFHSLMLYLSQCERDLITTALQQDLDSDDQDELLDLLDRLGVKTVPSKDALKTVLIQLAHKQIIQQPKYALDNMSAVAAQLLRTKLTTTAKIQTMYDDKKPTSRKVLKMIEASPVTPAESQSFRFLQQYIRGLDEVGLRRMLRFVTGSDVICVTNIEVVFTTSEGLARRPIAHTCGSVLALPCTYNSYPELRVEMENVLTSNYYNMDIV